MLWALVLALLAAAQLGRSPELSLLLLYLRLAQVFRGHMRMFLPYVLTLGVVIFLIMTAISEPSHSRSSQNLKRGALWVFTILEIYFALAALFRLFEVWNVDDYAFRSEVTQSFIRNMITAVLSLIVALIYERKVARARLQPCPWCGEYVQPSALICRYCRKDLS